MKNTLKKGLSLGIGLAVTSKEQVEKLVNELVEKGAMTRQESKEFFNDVLEKGKETQKQMDERINSRIQQKFEDMDFVTKQEVQALKNRIELLEKKLEEKE